MARLGQGKKRRPHPTNSSNLKSPDEVPPAQRQGKLPKPPPYRQISGTYQESRPAQLSPDVIAKFQRDDVVALVQSFTESVQYQNETDRETRQLHYGYLNKTETKKLIVRLAVITSAFGYLYITKTSVSSSLPFILLFLLLAIILLSETLGKIWSFFEGLFRKS